MSGAQPNHNRIVFNTTVAIGRRLLSRGSACQGFTSDQRVKVNDHNSPYLYPDLSVACQPKFEKINGLLTLLNPILIIEVLSPSTAEYDKRAKFLQYQSIESLEYYVLIDSEAMAMLYYQKSEKNWLPTFLSEANDELVIDSIGIVLKIEEVYLQVDFE
jgi:Uma2 family endonuclease